MDIKNRPRIPIPDEDPYSIAGNGSGSSGSSGFAGGSVAATREQLLLQTQQHAQRRGDKPPKLPPRDMYHDIPKPDYDDQEEQNVIKSFPSSRNNKEKTKDNKKYDDPYYCGLRARVPNFVAKSKANKESLPSKRYSINQQQQHQQILMHQQMNMNHHQIHQHPMWHARSYESGIDSDAIESPYNQIYGRLPIPTRNYIPAQPRTMYIGEWD